MIHSRRFSQPERMASQLWWLCWRYSSRSIVTLPPCPLAGMTLARGGERLGVVRPVRALEAAVERVPQRLLARVVVQVEAEPVHHVGERHVAIRVVEGKRATRPGMPEGPRARAEAERPMRARVAEREGGLDLQHLVVPAVLGRPGIAGQLVEGRPRESQLAPLRRELRVRARDVARVADPPAGRELDR